jgi:hypothetical protein
MNDNKLTLDINRIVKKAEEMGIEVLNEKDLAGFFIKTDDGRYQEIDITDAFPEIKELNK